MVMVLGIVLLVGGIAAALWMRGRSRRAAEIAQFSVSALELHALLYCPDPVMVVDVRHPLDLLADSNIIPGSIRFAPKEVIANPALVPCDRAVVFYCTCPSDETARTALHGAHKANHHNVKFLRGGLAAWKAQNLPVETYDVPFHLDTA